MAERRPQVDSGLGQQPVRPVASPVDTYQRPGAGNLARLADALSDINPALQQFGAAYMQRKKVEWSEETEAEAREAYLKGAKTMQAAVEKGYLRPDQNEYQRRAADNYFGARAASDYSGDLNRAMIEAGVTDSNDGEAFRTFEQEYRAKWLTEKGMTEQSVEFQNSFGRVVDANVGNANSQFMANAGERHRKEAMNAMVASEAEWIAEQKKAGISQDTMAKGLKMTVERAILHTMGTKAEVNEAAINIVVQAAEATGDESLLDLLNEVETVGGAKLGFTKEAIKLKSEALQRIRGDKENAKQLEIDTLEQEIGAILVDAEDPMGVNVETQLDRLRKLDVTRASTVENAIASVRLGLDAPENDATIEWVQEELWKPGSKLGLNGILKLAGQGKLHKGGLREAMGMLSQRDNYRDARAAAARARSRDKDNDPAFDTDAYKQVHSALNGGAIGQPGALDKIIGTGDLSGAKDRALSTFNREWHQWYHREGKNLPYQAQQQYAESLRQSIVDSVADKEVRNVVGDTRAPWMFDDTVVPDQVVWELERSDANFSNLSDEAVGALLTAGVPLDVNTLRKFTVVQNVLRAKQSKHVKKASAITKGDGEQKQ